MSIDQADAVADLVSYQASGRAPAFHRFGTGERHWFVVGPRSEQQSCGPKNQAVIDAARRLVQDAQDMPGALSLLDLSAALDVLDAPFEVTVVAL